MEEPIAVESVVFDVGGTLIDPVSSVGEIYASVASEHGWTGLDAKRLDDQFHEAWKSKGEFHYRLEDWEKMVIQSFAGVLEPRACSDISQHFIGGLRIPRAGWCMRMCYLP